MPGLASITHTRRKLAQKLISHRITSFQVFTPKILHDPESLFNQKIVGTYFKKITVYGKILVFKLNNGYYLFTYLHSAGDLVISPGKTKYTRAIFKFDNGLTLLYNDMRLQGYFRLFTDRQRKRIMVDFGTLPTAKDFNFSSFKDLLENKRTTLKKFLINQAYFPGLDDLLSDEICFAARVRPDRGVKELSRAHIKRIYSAIKRILSRAIKHHHPGISVYNREGLPCIRCHRGKIKKEKISSRWTFYCPLCQK